MSTRIFVEDNVDLTCVLFHREQSRRHIMHSFNNISADEKLRSLGGKHHGGSKTTINVVPQQTPHSTSSLGRHPGRPPDPIQIHPTKSVSQEHLPSAPQTIPQKSASAVSHQKVPRSQPPREPPPDPPVRVQVSKPLSLHKVEVTAADDNDVINDNYLDDSEMSERRIQRLGRRDVGAGKTQQQQNVTPASRAAEIKRRSRSEGPASRLKPRNSMDEKKMYEVKSAKSGQYKGKQQRTRHSMYTEPLSDDGGFPDIQGSSTSASDSDESNRKKWVKNPLIVKRMKKSDKRKSMNSATDNTGKENYNAEMLSVRTSNKNPQMVNRDLYIMQDRNSNNSQKGKYQKLEERRRRRVDITVTSDEELNSPELRISKLRQRALQGTKMATKLPDRLEDAQRMSHTQMIGHMTPEAMYRESKHQDQVEQGSSSSEQITLRQIGPGHNLTQDRFHQMEVQNNNYNQARFDNVRNNNSNISLKDSYHGHLPQNKDGRMSLTGQGSYKKIPKQETDYMRQTESNVSRNLMEVPKSSSIQRSESYGSRDMPERFREQRQVGGVAKYSKAINEFGSNPSYQPEWIRQQRKGGSDTEMSFTEVKTNKPMMLKKAIDRVDRKRKSYSEDDDSLDELIESNIQYLESEIESGKLQKIPLSKPAMFPVNKQEVHQGPSNSATKRRSTSLDNVSRPAQSSFQNEVKLRLQIPSSVSSPPRQVYYSKPKENEKVYEPYGSRSDIPVTTSVVNLPVTTAPSAARTNMYNMYQNTVPNRRHQSATHSPYMQRRSTELADMEDLSKSDSQLNSAEFAPAYAVQYGVQHQPYKSRMGHVYSTEGLAHYDNVSFPKQEQTNIKSLSVPVLEQGMFSDVEYDIEVSERVKKWEKLMKKKVSQPGTEGSKEAVSLTTILENEGGIPDSWLQNAASISESPYVPQSRAVSSISVTVTKSTSHVDPSKRKEPDRQLMVPEVEDPRVLTTETSSHRIFRLVQQPGSTALTKTTDSTVTYVANPETMAPVHHERQKTLYGDESKARMDTAEERLQSDTYDKESVSFLKPAWPPRRNKPQTDEQKQARLSKFEEELSELQELKQDSVKDLRRKFDSEGSGNESTDVADELSSACRTPLRQRKQYTKIVYHVPETKQLEEKTVRQSRRRNSGAYSDKSNVVSDISSPLPEAEVWSPNLESSKGLVSIERVKARTLQTIPFSEDPIWKQIEEMTSFDQLMQSGNPLEATPSLRPGESVAYIKRNDAVDVPCVSYSQSSQVSAPEMIYTTSTSPPRSRAFATPVIKPLKLISSPEKSSIAALDEVLEDIRTSLQKKSVPGTLERMSPKYSPMLSPSVVKPTQQVFSTPPIMTSSSVAVAPASNIRPPETQSYSANVPQTHRLAELQNQFNLSTQQPVQPSMQNQQTVLQPMHIIPDYTQEPYIINGNYQLDPILLKEKLLGTGLAADGSDVESLHGLMSGRRSTTPTTGLYQPLQQTSIQSQQSEAERQVLKTVEDLKNLAKDVEKRLSQIRTRMESSDENKLDSILNALRNFTPAVEPTVVQQPTVHLSSEYATKKNKLQEALSELDRIYEELDLKDRPIATVTSEIKGNTVPRQFRASSDTQIYTKKRNKSDSDFSDVGLSGITIADIERQTQKEFEDINLAFQTLLAEVDNPPKEEEEEEVVKTEVYSKDYQSNADEIEATIESFLQEFGQTQSLGSKSSNFNKALEDFNSKKESQNKCRDIQKSEVYTVSSGPFSVVVGLNGKHRRAGTTTESSNRAVVRRKRPVPMPSKPSTTHSIGAQTVTVETVEASPRSDVKVSKANDVIKDTLSDKDIGNDDCSDSSEQSGGNRRFSKRGKRFNAHHRKSLPAEILKRSVETQTIEPSSQVEVVKEKFQPKEFDRLREDSLSSESSVDTRIPQKRKVAKNIARKLEIFSSSEDEKGRRSKLSHSHSAPDIRELFDFDKVTSKPGTHSSKSQTPRLVKQRYEARVRRKTSVNNRDTPTDEKSEEISWTSATSDDGSQVSQGSKPPVHPGKKQKSSSPDRIVGEVKPGQTRKASSDAESNVDSDVVVLRRKKSNSQDDTPERPHSFHELLAMFETNPDRLHKLKHSLRKCASADNVSVETVLRKSYHSEPDLREDSPFSSGAKLDLEIKVKNV